MTTTRTLSTWITLACLSFAANQASGGQLVRAEAEAELLLANIEKGVLLEQFRSLRMNMFKTRLELKLQKVEIRFLAEADRDRARQDLELHAERLNVLEQTATEVRARIVKLHGRLTDQPARPPSQAGIDGEWVGRDQAHNVELRLVVNGSHARFESPSDGVWYEGEFSVETDGEAPWKVAFHIENCSDEQYRGKTSLGLIQVENQQLKFAANEPGTPTRPSNFEHADDTMVVTFKRR